MEDYETVLLVKPEVFMFKIPPRATNRGYRAADWKLDSPDWTGRMRVVSKGKKCFIKLEDKNTDCSSMETIRLQEQTRYALATVWSPFRSDEGESVSLRNCRELFAKSPIDKYPGIAVEAVMDSSRYFVLRIEDDNGRAAFIGIGFADRGDSFDLNVALQEHFKWLQKSEEIEKGMDAPETKSNLDLGFKEGQTITINMNIGKKSGSTKPRPKTSGFSGTPGLLPPPPGGVKIPPPASKPAQQISSQEPAKPNSNAAVNKSTNSDLLLDFDLQPAESNTNQTSSAPQNSSGTDLWGDFTTAASSSSTVPGKVSSSENWIDF